ncbi:MAG: sulfite exporter TauE/SafE family protein, partial [Gammaproteobacteria bacterium]|nr:sulfite exporter TauE/SafE family protein [Gammaproteobacteria bacterium]
TLAAFGIDLQVLSALLLVPIAGVGHVIGLKVHEMIMHNDLRFKRVVGGVLIVICGIGLVSIL